MGANSGASEWVRDFRWEAGARTGGDVLERSALGEALEARVGGVGEVLRKGRERCEPLAAAERASL